MAALALVALTGPAGARSGGRAAAAARYVYWTNPDGSIGRATSDGSGAEPAFLRPPAPFPVARGPIAVTGTHLFWISETKDTTCFIGRANLDGSQGRSAFIRVPSCFRLRSLATNGVTLYWGQDDAAGGSASVGRAGVNGDQIEPGVVKGCGGTNPIRALAVDTGHLYWSGGCSTSIHRSTLDGAETTADWIAQPTGDSIAVTLTNVYWVAADGRSIGRAAIDGSAVEGSWLDGTLGAGGRVSGVAADVAHVYWLADLGTGASVARAAVNGRAATAGFVPLPAAALGLAVTPFLSIPPGGAPVGVSEGTVTVNGMPFEDGSAIPFGAKVDVSQGMLDLVSEVGPVSVQGAPRLAGAFKIMRLGKTRGGATIALRLTGGNFRVCKTAPVPASHTGRKPPKAKRKKTAVRRLTAKAKGKYRTRGNYGAATVLGTSWVLTDRCDGTLVHTIQGTVSVLDIPKHKTVRVRAGRSYLAAKP